MSFKLVKLPAEDQGKGKIILDEIYDDIEIDIINPFTSKTTDMRVYKIGLKSIDIIPN
jgi:hypothetical protein